jgi:DNA-binding LacI/PurR family transcriptional regulator
MCEYAIEAIVKKVKGEKVPSQVVFPVELIDRESTK